jgi:hypothetical protein
MSKKHYLGILWCAGTIYAFATGIVKSEVFVSWAATAIQNQVVQAGFFYMVGQWLNNLMLTRKFGAFQGEVLETINNFSASMKASLDNVAEALRADLATKASRSEMQAGFDKVNGRIDALGKL